METIKKQLKGGQKGLAIVIALALSFEGIPALLYAQEATDGAAVGQVAQQQAARNPRRARLRNLFKNNPELRDRVDANDDGKISRRELQYAKKKKNQHNKKEKVDQWLENHPNVADRLDRNDDGKVGRRELKAAKRFRKNKQRRDRMTDRPRRDLDNNPPGRIGGPGTNWENPPGPAGGAGTGPNHNFRRRDRDNNPPGRVGGPGTNWENPPGRRGGPGASPDRRGRAGRNRNR